MPGYFFHYRAAEVLERSSGEDKVEDKTFGRVFPRSRMRRGEEFFPFPRPFRGRDEEFLGISAFFSAILRTRLLILVFRGRGRDEARNFASFLGHFEVETRPSRTSAWNGVFMLVFLLKWCSADFWARNIPP